MKSLPLFLLLCLFQRKPTLSFQSPSRRIARKILDSFVFLCSSSPTQFLPYQTPKGRMLSFFLGFFLSIGKSICADCMFPRLPLRDAASFWNYFTPPRRKPSIPPRCQALDRARCSPPPVPLSSIFPSPSRRSDSKC